MKKQDHIFEVMPYYILLGKTRGKENKTRLHEHWKHCQGFAHVEFSSDAI
jgi:hypothetical protein